MFGGAPTFRYPTPITNTHGSPAMSLTPPPDQNDPPVLEGQFYMLPETFKNHDRSASGSPTSSTAAEPDTELPESFDSEATWPNDSDDWNTRSALREPFAPSTGNEWTNLRSEDSARADSTEVLTGAIDNDLLDIDE